MRDATFNFSEGDLMSIYMLPRIEDDVIYKTIRSPEARHACYEWMVPYMEAEEWFIVAYNVADLVYYWMHANLPDADFEKFYDTLLHQMKSWAEHHSDTEAEEKVGRCVQNAIRLLEEFRSALENTPLGLILQMRGEPPNRLPTFAVSDHQSGKELSLTEQFPELKNPNKTVH